MHYKVIIMPLGEYWRLNLIFSNSKYKMVMQSILFACTWVHCLECHWHWFQVMGACGKNSVHCLFMAVEWLTTWSHFWSSQHPPQVSSLVSSEIDFFRVTLWLFSHFQCPLGIAISDFPVHSFFHVSFPLKHDHLGHHYVTR